MKRIIYILLLFIPTVLQGNDARIERWQSRIDRMSGYKSKAAKLTGVIPYAENLFSDEIKSADELISILKRYNSGDGSLKSETRKYTIEEIESATAGIASPVIAVFYTAELIKEEGNPAVKSEIKEEINRYAASKGLNQLKKESREAELLAKKYIIQKFISGYEIYRQKALAEILGLTEYELSRTGYSSNNIDLNRIIISAADKTSSAGVNRETGFNEAHLINLPEWKDHIESSAINSRKTDAAAAFAESRGIKLTPEEKKKGIPYIEKQVFLADKSLLTIMCENTEKSSASGHNNPSYEIPDFKKIQTAIEDIDHYRKSLTVSMNGAEGNGFLKKIRDNNLGLSEKYLKQYTNLFTRERMRISNLKKSSSGIIVYNEEIFNAAEKHFCGIREKLIAYSNLSSDYIDAIYPAWKIDPEKYLSQYKVKTDKNLEYISFIERITSDAASAGKTGDGRINNLYRSSAKEIFPMMRNLYTAEQIPGDVRSAMSKEHIKTHAEINQSLRIKGTAHALSARKNYDIFTAAYSEAIKSRKEGALASERSIGQEEVDRLMSCAKKFSGTIASLSYTSMALKNYSEEYKQITDDIRDGKDLSHYLEKINSGSIIPLVADFSPEKIDCEIKLRDLLAREGNESLSGAIALMQYYNRKGVALKYIYTPDEIKTIKDNFGIMREETVASWRMNGKNYRLIDTNSTESLKKLINKKAWNPNTKNELKTLKEKFAPAGKINFAVSLPDGWSRTTETDDSEAALSLSFRSPDLLGKILLRAVRFDNDNIQIFSDEWSRTNGFTPVAKEWGKLSGNDYLMTVSKNRYDTVMESYIIRKDGYVIQISGVADRKKYGVMNKSLKDIFSSLEI